MYNFGVLSFQSYHVKFEVILKIQKSKNCPLLILNSNFKNYAEFEKGQNMKNVVLEKSSNFLFWSFSCCLEILGEKEERRGENKVVQHCYIPLCCILHLLLCPLHRRHRCPPPPPSHRSFMRHHAPYHGGISKLLLALPDASLRLHITVLSAVPFLSSFCFTSSRFRSPEKFAATTAPLANSSSAQLYHGLVPHLSSSAPALAA
jgi:hypothetical protein